MKSFIYCFTILFALLTCNKRLAEKPFTSDIPFCIQQKIDSIKKLQVGNPPTIINEYDYAKGKVYVISAPCCDFFTVAVDSNCNYVCAPSGGFTGKGDRKCADFSKSAKLIRTVWKDSRKKE